MPARKCVASLKEKCLIALAELYIDALPTILANGDVSKARDETLERWPKQLYLELLKILENSDSMERLLRTYNCNDVYRFLLTSKIQDVCLVPYHSHEFDSGYFWLPHSFQYELQEEIDSEVVLQDLVHVGNSKLARLHLPKLPSSICKMISTFQNLKCIWVHNYYPNNVSKGPILEELVEYLEKVSTVDDIRISGFSIPPKVLSTLRSMSHLRELNVRWCDVSCQDAALLLCELPNLVAFGWGESPAAFVQLMEYVHKFYIGNCNLEKLQKWYGVVSVGGLMRCGKPVFELLNADVRHFFCSLVQVAENRDDTSLENVFVDLEMEGNFGLVSQIGGKGINDFLLKEIISDNGYLITKLFTGKGAIYADTLYAILRCCPNLEVLDLWNTLILNTEQFVHLDSARYELRNLSKFKYSLGEDSYMLEEYSTELSWLRTVIASTVCIKTLIIYIRRDDILVTDESLYTMLPNRMEKLEVFEFIGWNSKVSNMSIDRLLEIAPNLKQIGAIPLWGNFTYEDQNDLKEKSVKNGWDLSLKWPPLEVGLFMSGGFIHSDFESELDSNSPSD